MVPDITTLNKFRGKPTSHEKILENLEHKPLEKGIYPDLWKTSPYPRYLKVFPRCLKTQSGAFFYIPLNGIIFNYQTLLILQNRKNRHEFFLIVRLSSKRLG